MNISFFTITICVLLRLLFKIIRYQYGNLLTVIIALAVLVLSVAVYYLLSLSKKLAGEVVETIHNSAELLQGLVGVYRNEQMGLIIAVTRSEKTVSLNIQPAGLPLFALVAVSEYVFKSQRNGIAIEFYPGREEFGLYKADGIMIFNKM